MKGTLKVYLPTWAGLGVDELLNADAATVLGACMFSAGKFTDSVLVGEAEVDVRLHGRDQVTNSAIAALRGRQKQVRAEAEVEAMRLERAIEKLLAITNGPAP